MGGNEHLARASHTVLARITFTCLSNNIKQNWNQKKNGVPLAGVIESFFFVSLEHQNLTQIRGSEYTSKLYEEHRNYHKALSASNGSRLR